MKKSVGSTLPITVASVRVWLLHIWDVARVNRGADFLILFTFDYFK